MTYEGQPDYVRGEVALEEVIAGLPEWMKPDPTRPPLPDPEREEYERLKRKFG